jgi:LacI family transcriptional regulator
MATIKDVAAMAGVSVASVSRAINDPASVATSTLERINAVIRKTGFAPNKLARSLKVQTSKSVAVIVPDISNPFHLKVIKGAEAVLAAAGYTLFIMDTEESAEKETRNLRDLLDRQIDGLVYIPVLTNQRLPRVLADSRIPVVVVDRALGNDHDTVLSNNYAGISLLLNHLASRGKRRIALIGGPEESPLGRERNQAFRSLVAQYRLDEDPALIRTGEFSVEAGLRLTKDLLRSGVAPDALLAAANFLGIGALKALREFQVPGTPSLELVVFDEVGELVAPPLSHVRQQAFEMGAQATRFLLERLQGLESAPRTVLFEPLLYRAEGN